MKSRLNVGRAASPTTADECYEDYRCWWGEGRLNWGACHSPRQRTPNSLVSRQCSFFFNQVIHVMRNPPIRDLTQNRCVLCKMCQTRHHNYYQGGLSDCSVACHGSRTSLELIPLPVPEQCWDCKYAQPCLTYIDFLQMIFLSRLILLLTVAKWIVCS